MTTSPTDSVLARTMSVRPDNKIAMRCPSWPDSPLHKYFGVSQSNRRDSGFVLSSLGYLRLYQSCCCTPETNLEPARADSGFRSSFVHLEERLRSDGPFILYQQPPERKMFGLGLTERAREKRLLKYYKYFQGFQRKLQVSRQFQQQSVRQTNKVQKIINCYKRAKKTEPSCGAIRLKRQVGSGVKTDGIRTTSDERIALKPGSRKLKGHDQIKDKECESDTNDGEEFIYPSSQNLTEEWRAYLASIDINANKFQRRLNRGTMIAPSLETILEASGESDAFASENPSVTALSKTLSQSAAKKAKNFSENSSGVVTKSTIPENTANVLKKSTPKSPDQILVNNERYKTAGKFSAKSVYQNVNINQFTNKENRRSKSPLRVQTSSETSFENVSSVHKRKRQLDTVSSGRVQAVTPRKKSAHRHFLMRSRRSTSKPSSSVHLDEEEEADQEEEENETNEEKEVRESIAEKEQLPKQKKRGTAHVPRSGHNSSNLSSDSKQRSAHSRGELTKKKKVQFTGWDLNSTLGSRTFKTCPQEQDLLQQMLQRVEQLNIGSKGQSGLSETTQFTEQRVCADRLNTKEYIERHGLRQVFQNVTNTLVLEQPDQPLALLYQRFSDLSQRYAQGVQIEEDLAHRTDLNEEVVKTRTSTASIRCGSHFRQPKPKFRISSSSSDRQVSRTFSVCEKMSIELKPVAESISTEPVESTSEKLAEEVARPQEVQTNEGMQTEEMETQVWFEEDNVDEREHAEEANVDSLEEGQQKNIE